jgi:hypothetical protein
VNDFDTGGAIIEAFRRADPIGTDVPDRRALPSAHSRFADITAQPPRRVRRRTAVVVIALVVAFVLGTLIGAFAVVDRGQPDVTAPMCYAAPSLSSRAVVVPAGGDVRTACAALWQNGDFGTGTVPSHFDVCELKTGAPAVFPGESGSVCAELGLASADLSSLDDRARAFESQAADAVEGRCVGYDQAHDLVAQYLDQFGLHGWTVGPNPDALSFGADRPCASLAFPGQQTVYIVPIPDLHASPAT